MTATTRWVEYDVTAEGAASGGDNDGLGTRGYALATASVQDTFDIAYSNNRFWFKLDGITSEYVTIASGTDLDPRFIAKDITEKIHNLSAVSTKHQFAKCVWENNAFKLYSGSLGSSSSAAVVSGTNTAHLTLGFGVKTELGGIATSNGYNGGVTISGTYNGFFDEVYKIVVSADIPIQTPTKGGSNSYGGAMETGGAYNDSTSITYTLSIDTSNGTTMGAGTGNVPKLSWTSTGNVDNGGPIELLYPNYWYFIGTKGLMVRFSDAVFNTCDPAWSIACNAVQYAEGSNTSAPAGTAKYYWGSDRGDNSASTYTTSSNDFTQLGARGLYIKFTGTSNFNAGDEFYVLCRPPQPKAYDITNLNYGNVTVSTESNVKTVLFEITSGAVEISTVKFGLQNHGTFNHHTAGDNDTYFRFGTIGPGNNAGAAPISRREWRNEVTPSDISSDTPPSYLYATKENLHVVADADNSEAIGGSTYYGMVADPIWLGIRLGASEVGANSTINYRIFFDYS
jgi:hypothetical protein